MPYVCLNVRIGTALSCHFDNEHKSRRNFLSAISIHNAYIIKRATCTWCQVSLSSTQTDGPARLLSKRAKTRFSKKVFSVTKISEISLGDKREMERDYKYMRIERTRGATPSSILTPIQRHALLHTSYTANLFPISYSTRARNFPSHTHWRHFAGCCARSGHPHLGEREKSVFVTWQPASEDEFSFG